jgi:integrase
MTVDLPSVLRPHTEGLRKDRGPDEFLFFSRRHKSGQPGRYGWRWLNRLAKRVREAAGTRFVPAHGLRDTYASL